MSKNKGWHFVVQHTRTYRDIAGYSFTLHVILSNDVVLQEMSLKYPFWLASLSIS